MFSRVILVSVAAGFIGSTVFAEGVSAKKVKKELSVEQKRKKELKKQAILAKLQTEYPEEMAKYNTLISAGKKSEARDQMQAICKKRTLKELDALAIKYPEKVTVLKKQLEDSSEKGQSTFTREYKALKKQVRDDRKQQGNSTSSK